MFLQKHGSRKMFYEFHWSRSLVFLAAMCVSQFQFFSRLKNSRINYLYLKHFGAESISQLKKSRCLGLPEKKEKKNQKKKNRVSRRLAVSHLLFSILNTDQRRENLVISKF